MCTRKPENSRDSFIVIVTLSGGLEPNPQYLWGLPVLELDTK